MFKEIDLFHNSVIMSTLLYMFSKEMQNNPAWFQEYRILMSGFPEMETFCYLNYYIIGLNESYVRCFI